MKVYKNGGHRLFNEIAEVSWKNNEILYVAAGREEAVKLSDDYAPEHLELHTKDNSFFFENLTNYGSLFIGEETTAEYGDKSIGMNHILPPAGRRGIPAASG